ncbi:hypothetical protein CAOG_06569 [Capsaspora owczarzaki ATCC 30864]|uniref:Uncharacterized protein n=1 Tax=Capsaspora owczarzaki (strain ATCC 30864) TaxID=595528 RepID=A0A0D2X4K4_CAPO3|nr:hypothetical protein CAOG_06569 [Capsaspora owczarzaki ATCC 30864]KJE96214.1 hypothetical protein CAOG_006569 [Capsaspora owczarzaki ATCC 30864]|eukprot:XP_004345318.1 hypothetical protein CAOG_06569 [Capsaspora owczarzaki ATCC 30864]
MRVVPLVLPPIATKSAAPPQPPTPSSSSSSSALVADPAAAVEPATTAIVLSPGETFIFLGELRLCVLAGQLAVLGSVLRSPQPTSAAATTSTAVHHASSSVKSKTKHTQERSTGANHTPSSSTAAPRGPISLRWHPLHSTLAASLTTCTALNPTENEPTTTHNAFAKSSRARRMSTSEPMDVNGTPLQSDDEHDEFARWQERVATAIPSIATTDTVLLVQAYISAARRVTTALGQAYTVFGSQRQFPSDLSFSLHIESAFGLRLDHRIPLFSVPPSWSQLADGLVAHRYSRPDPPVILACGGKDVGKSTLCRFLVNVLLDHYPAVAYIETDPGQCEFTPSGFVALNIVTEPCFGPSFTHLQQPDLAFCIGESSAKSDPEAYLEAVLALLEQYQELAATQPQLPLIINTHGWVKGLGLDLILDVLCFSRPSHIAQFFTNMPAKNLPILDTDILQAPVSRILSNAGGVAFPPMHEAPAIHQMLRTPWSAESTSGIPVHQRVTLPPPLGANQLRNLQFSIYFLTLQDSGVVDGNFEESSVAESLLHLVPYAVPWSAVQLRVMHAEVPPSQVLFAFNVSVVGLLKHDDSALAFDLGEFSATSPQILASTPQSPCIGLGIVRGIDPVNQLFYISTPVPLALLGHVGILTRTSLELPTTLLLKESLADAPYMTFAFPSILAGGGVRKNRKNLQRRKNE